MSTQKLLPAFTPQQHRRRVSLPASPPETPVSAFFGPDSRKPPATTSSTIVFPDTPPATPTRATSGSAVDEKREGKSEDKGLPRPASHRRAPSQAYANTGRTSAATVLRLALAGQAPVLSPPKLLALLLLVIFASSFLPSPLTLFRHSLDVHSRAVDSRPATASPTHAQNSRPAVPIGETAQRKAWESTFPYRIPPQQHVVAGGSDGKHPEPTSHDGDLFRQHPDLLAEGVRPGRRVPLRLEKARPAVVVEKAAASRDEVDASFDDASRSPPRRGPSWGKDTQLSRMKKVAVAKGRNARVGVAPLDSSNALKEQDRVIVEDGATKKKLRNPSGAVLELEKELQAEREAPQKRRSTHHERSLPAKQGGQAGSRRRGVFNWKTEADAIIARAREDRIKV